MKASVILTLLVSVALTFAAGPAALQNTQQEARFYYGRPGSQDYVTGTIGPQEPAFAWQLHSNMPTAMMDNAAAANETHAYVAAGYSVGRKLYRHAIGGTTWETLTDCPLDLSTGGAAIIGDTFYYCGGYKDAMRNPADTLFKYSISGNDWTSGPGPYSGGMGYNWMPSVFACMGKLYYVSGCSVPGATNPTRRVHCYTPGAGWAQVASLNQGSVFASGWVYNDTIWLAGGITGASGITRTEFYDPVADTWVIDNATFPQLPYPVWGAGSGVVANTGYVACGVLTTGGLGDSVAYFDHSVGTWSVDEPVHQRVYRTTAAGNADGRAVVYGGSTGGFTPTSICQYEILASPNANDVGVITIIAPAGVQQPGTVTPKAMIKNFGTDPQSDIPVYCWIDSAGSRVYDEMETYAGPLAPGASAEVTFTPDWEAVNGMYDVTMFTAHSGDENNANDSMFGTVNVTAAEWIQITQLPDSADRVVHCVIYDPVNDKVYMIGGNAAGASASYRGLNDMYDPAAGDWTSKAAMVDKRGWCAGTYCNGKIYMIGGHNNAGGFPTTNEEYDIAGNAWTTKAPRPRAAAAPGCVTWNDTLVYVMGGTTGSVGLTNVDIYDPASNSWAVGTALPQGTYMGTAAIIGDTIYIAQAYTGPCWNNLYKGAIDPANPTQISWIMGPSLSEPVFNGGTAAVNGEVFWIGGFVRGATVSNHVWKYSPQTGAISQFSPNYPITLARCDFVCGRDMSDGGELYVMAGDRDGNWQAPNRDYWKIQIGQVGVEEPVGGLEVACRVMASVGRDLAHVSYTVARSGQVDLGVYDASGALVRTLVSGHVDSGTRTAVWNRTDNNGRRVANGTYFYRLTVDGGTVSAKSVVLD